jgi:hypothetical protein
MSHTNCQAHAWSGHCHAKAPNAPFSVLAGAVPLSVCSDMYISCGLKSLTPVVCIRLTMIDSHFGKHSFWSMCIVRKRLYFSCPFMSSPPPSPEQRSSSHSSTAGVPLARWSPQLSALTSDAHTHLADRKRQLERPSDQAPRRLRCIPGGTIQYNVATQDMLVLKYPNSQ